MRHKFEFNQCDGPVAPRNALVGAGKVNLYSANRIERIGRLEVFYFFFQFFCLVRSRACGPMCVSGLAAQKGVDLDTLTAYR